jgi:hypothetical protein
MTHHATNLDLPGEANITTAAGDVATFQSTGANTVQCINYTKANGEAVVSAGGGKILQVVSTTVTDRNSATHTDTSDGGADCGLNVTLTALSSTSRYLIQLDVGVITSTNGNSVGMILSKGGVKIGNGVDVSNRNGVWARAEKYGMDGNHGYGLSASYFDTVSTTAGSSVTYKSGLVTQSGTAYINMMITNDDNSLVYGSYTSSTITVMEVEA